MAHRPTARRRWALAVAAVVALAGPTACSSSDAGTDSALLDAALSGTPGTDGAPITDATCQAAEDVAALDVSSSERYNAIVDASAEGEITAAEADAQWAEASAALSAAYPDLQEAYARLAAGAPTAVANDIELVSGETLALFEVLRTLGVSGGEAALNQAIVDQFGIDRLQDLVDAAVRVTAWAGDACGVDLNAA